MQPSKLQCCIRRDSIKPSPIFVSLCVLCFQRLSFLLLFYYICHCMSLHVCLGEIFILDSRLAILGKKLSFWLSACSVLIVALLL